MNRVSMLLAASCVLGCQSSVEPSPLYTSYFLTAVNDKPLPVPFAEDGSVLLAGSLGFDTLDRPRAGESTQGTVNYTILVRRADQTQEHSTIALDYAIQDGELRINLCPPLALCIASTELVGPVPEAYHELVLTHHLAGNAVATYRYFPSLPD
jgi:hypothetical protein